MISVKQSLGHKRADGQIEYVPEYLVVFRKVVEIAKEYDLTLVRKENFHK